MALSKTTQDHDEIRQWAESRGGKPAEVASTEHDGETGIIRFMFPNAPHHNDSALKEIEWDDFFEKFDKSGLALVYQEHTADGQPSDFNRFIHPENASHSASTDTDSSSATKKTPAKKSSKSASTKASSSKAAKKAPAKKSSATSVKAAGRKAPAKSAAKKAPAKAAKKAPAKAAKKAPSKAAKKAAPKKAAKKISSKVAPKKAAPKKTALKKTPSKKSAAPTRKAVKGRR